MHCIEGPKKNDTNLYGKVLYVGTWRNHLYNLDIIDDPLCLIFLGLCEWNKYFEKKKKKKKKKKKIPKIVASVYASFDGFPPKLAKCNEIPHTFTELRESI